MSMTAISIPEILDHIAQAGAVGISIDPSAAGGSLELCRKQGYQFESSNGRICLPFNRDWLVPYWIKREISQELWASLSVSGFFETESTNDEVLKQARSGALEGYLVFSETQSSGRGRIGRRWISTAGAGLYFSLLLRPACRQKDWPLLTFAVSLALYETLRDLKVCGIADRTLAIDLKWPNDVFISGKKAAGILLETTGQESAVVGIGINVSKGSVPDELKEEAVSIEHEAKCFIPRRWLLVRFMKNFGGWYRRFTRGEFAAILDQWKAYSSMWDKTPIWVTESRARRAATTCGLSDTGGLKILTGEGKQEILLAGDVSVRRSFDPRKGQ